MLKVTLKRSVIGYNKRQRATVKALGLNKIGSSAVHAESNSILGMIRKVEHLLDVERLSDPVEVKE
jgi:large subunit ribosomal protein L30